MKYLSFILVLVSLVAGSAVRPLAALAETPEDIGWVPLGPPGGDVSHLLVHPRNPQILWAGTRFYGIYKSVDGGASWSATNQGLDRQNVQALAVAPSDPQTLYVAAGGRVYRSGNGGQTWTVMLPCGDEPPPCCGCVPLSRVQELVVHPRSPQTVFAVTRRGLLQSDDGGAKWRKIRLNDGLISTLVFEPGNPNVLYAGGYGQLFKSTNGGTSWKLWSDRLSEVDVERLVIDPRNPRRMWAAEFSFSDSVVYRSTDGGVHWRLSRSGLPSFPVTALALGPATGAGLPIVWIGNDVGVFRSLDGGVTWSAALRNRSVRAIATHPSQPATLWAGTQPGRFPSGIYKSVNRGAVWTFSSRGIFNTATSSLAFDPVTPGILWAAAGSTIWRSADGGSTWAERRGNIPRSFFVQAIAVDPRDPETVWAGTSRGVYVSEDGGATWEERREGLTAPGAQPVAGVLFLRLAPSNPSIAYAGSFEALFKTVDAGRHWSLLLLPAPSFPEFVALQDVWVDPRDPDVLFAARGGIWASRDGGASWSLVPVGNGSTTFQSVEADPRNPDVLYAGGEEGMFRSADGGQVWQLVTDVPITWQGNLAVGPAGEVWVGDLGGIYFSPDGVSGWTLLPGLTPYHNVFVLAADPHDPGTVFASTYTFDSSGTFYGLFRHPGD